MYTFFYVTFNYMPYLKFKRFFPECCGKWEWGGESHRSREDGGKGGGNFLLDKP